MTNPDGGVRLELTWPNKDKFLLSPADDSGKPVWVDRDHPAATEVRINSLTGAFGDVNGADPYADNLLFTGDSIDMLRILAEQPEYRRHYRGKVKQVYIDPPFNTGQTFTHYDDWMDHSTWLSFMRDRLILIKELLSPDGSVWVHLDHTESHRMRLVLDEVFGAGNFVADIAWQKATSPRNNNTGFSVSQDSIVVYSRSGSWIPNRVARLESTTTSRFTSARDNDPVPWRDGDPTATGDGKHHDYIYAIEHPVSGTLMYPPRGRHWAMNQSWMLEQMQGWAPYELRYLGDEEKRAEICGVGSDVIRPGTKAIMLAVPLDEASVAATRRFEEGSWPELVMLGLRDRVQRKKHLVDDGRVPETLWLADATGSSLRGKNQIKDLFPESHPFSTPKPEELLKQVIHIGTAPGDIVLDCFGGSGTTAAVAHKMGRRWVTSEILADTVGAFTRPRLEKVQAGADPGGITETVTWCGGDGFRTVDIGPSMYESTPFGVMLADWDTNGQIARAVAGQLGFEYSDDETPFCGARGRMRLAVFDGALGVEEVRHAVAALGDREKVTFVAKAVLPGVEDLVLELSKGSRVRKAPRDLLTAAAKRARRITEKETTQ